MPEHECPRCGRTVADEARFCPFCGTEQPDATPPTRGEVTELVDRQIQNFKDGLNPTLSRWNQAISQLQADLGRSGATDVVDPESPVGRRLASIEARLETLETDSRNFARFLNRILATRPDLGEPEEEPEEVPAPVRVVARRRAATEPQRPRPRVVEEPLVEPPAPPKRGFLEGFRGQ